MREVQRGWYTFGVAPAFTVDVGAPELCGMQTLMLGSEIRNTFETSALSNDRADYFIERLIINGTVYTNPAADTDPGGSLGVVRVGTIPFEETVVAPGSQLISETNMEFWSRILYDQPVAGYRPASFFRQDGAIVTTTTNSDPVLMPWWPQTGPTHFEIDIQQRFSLQRENICLALSWGPAPTGIFDGDEWTCDFWGKALVRKYRVG